MLRNVKFVVLTSSRTGSTWLMDMLNAREGVRACGELFLAHGRLTPAIAGLAEHPRFVEVHGRPGLARPLHVFSYLNGLYDAPGAVGFKLMYMQLGAHPEILLYLAARRVRVIHLIRRNHIDVVISEELARLTGVSHVWTGATLAAPKVRLDPATLVDRVRKLDARPRQAARLIRLTRCPSIAITYEALLEGDAELTRVLDFLAVPGPRAQTASRLTKRGTRPHRDAIENYEEVRQVLASTPFAHLLH